MCVQCHGYTFVVCSISYCALCHVCTCNVVVVVVVLLMMVDDNYDTVVHDNGSVYLLKDVDCLSVCVGMCVY